jgi:L-seryl-tRNA(Ser) seleniumtransferase
MTDDKRRALPSVDTLLRDPGVLELMNAASRNAVVGAVREAIERSRKRRAGAPDDWAAEIAELVARRIAPSLAPVINATGIVLHTNLGRAPLAAAAVSAVHSIASGYSTLEFDLHSGTRGSRADHCRVQLARLTGADDALVVNNAAGALVLALATVAAGREVIISRGELIEIGGSFRIPDILAKSGARLHEVGTTNRTHLADYEGALGPDTGAILIVHRSNFAQSGFVATPDPSALSALASERGLPCLHDIGSGLLLDLSPWGLAGEPRVADAVAAGADLVLFSGDKLLGGPQAGCLVGRRALVAGCRSDPLARALRADKLTLAALEATLALYDDEETARREVPVLRMLTESPGHIEARARRLLEILPARFQPALVEGESAVGGGAFPAARLPTTLVALSPGEIGAHGLALRLRLGRPAVIARVQDQRVLLDVRTVAEPELEALGAAVEHVET